MTNPIVLRSVKLLHKIYKITLSPLIGNQCRFHPTCSDYTVLAIEKHGFWRGGYLAFKRIIRCNPFHPGGIDPVPEDDSIEAQGHHGR